MKWTTKETQLTLTVNGDPVCRRNLESRIKTKMREWYLKRLLSKPDQGKMLKVSTTVWQVTTFYAMAMPQDSLIGVSFIATG